MQPRNARFAGLAIAVAAAAVGAGAVVSANAMAASDGDVTGTATVSVVSAGIAGIEGPVSCTFDSSELPTPPLLTEAASAPTGVGPLGPPPAGATVIMGGGAGVTVSGEAGDPGPVLSVNGPITGGPVLSTTGPVGVDGTPPPGAVLTVAVAGAVPGDLPAGANVITMDGARTGTEQECAAILEDMRTLPQPDTQVQQNP